MKLHAILETSSGKRVMLSDNESIRATVYDGDLKAYSVTIEWCDIGDIEHDPSTCINSVPCYECEHPPTPTKGALILCREWRNMPEEQRKGDITLDA